MNRAHATPEIPITLNSLPQAEVPGGGLGRAPHENTNAPATSSHPARRLLLRPGTGFGAAYRMRRGFLSEGETGMSRMGGVGRFWGDGVVPGARLAYCAHSPAWQALLS